MRDQMTSQNFISQKRDGCTKIRKLIPLAFISIRLMSPSRGAVASAPSSSSQRSLETFVEPEMPTGRHLSKDSRKVGTFAASRFATIVLRAVFSQSRINNPVAFCAEQYFRYHRAFGTRVALHLSPGENDERD
jgi:hypothetical protein